MVLEFPLLVNSFPWQWCPPRNNTSSTDINFLSESDGQVRCDTYKPFRTSRCNSAGPGWGFAATKAQFFCGWSTPSLLSSPRSFIHSLLHPEFNFAIKIFLFYHCENYSFFGWICNRLDFNLRNGYYGSVCNRSKTLDTREHKHNWTKFY